MAMQVKVLEDIAGLCDYQAQWDDLASRSGNFHPQYSFPELLNTVRFRRDPGQWRCHLLFSNGMLRCAALATRVYVGRMGLRFMALELEILLSDAVEEPGIDPAMTQLIHSMLNSPGGPVFLQAGNLTRRASEHLRTVLADQGLNCLQNPNGSAYFFDTTRPLQALLARMPKSFRRTFKRQEGRLGRQYPIEFEMIQQRDADLNRQLFLDFQRLEDSGWKGAAGTSLGMQPDWSQYFENICKEAADRGQMRWYRLKAGDRTISMYMCLCSPGTVWTLKTAYDAEMATFSPGNLLLMRILARETSAAETARVEMITGPEWLRKWRPEETPLFQLRIFPSSPRGVLAYWAGRIGSHAGS